MRRNILFSLLFIIASTLFVGCGANTTGTTSGSLTPTPTPPTTQQLQTTDSAKSKLYQVGLNLYVSKVQVKITNPAELAASKLAVTQVQQSINNYNADIAAGNVAAMQADDNNTGQQLANIGVSVALDAALSELGTVLTSQPTN